MLDNGDVFAFGYNYQGLLGLGDTTQKNLPQQLAVSPQGRNIIMLKCGAYHIVAQQG